MDYDSALLETVAQRFRRDMWKSVVAEAVTESGVEVANFGPVQATAFGDLPEVHGLNQVQGAAEPGAVEDGHLATAVEWMRAREVDYRVPVAESRPGTYEAEAWLSDRGYERGGGWIKLVRKATLPDWPEDPGIEIYEIGEDEADGEGLSTIISEALELPVTAGTLFFSLPQEDNWRCYTAALGADEPVVATGSMLIMDGIAQLARHDPRGGQGVRLQHRPPAPSPRRRRQSRLPHHLRRAGRSRPRQPLRHLPPALPRRFRGGLPEPKLAAAGAAPGADLAGPRLVRARSSMCSAVWRPRFPVCRRWSFFL